MLRLLVALLAATAPFALAHTPPGPVLNCESFYGPHDYVGTTDAGGPSARAPAQDGNLDHCPGPNGVFLDYDGHHEFGYGVARLAVEEGDHVTGGSWMCVYERAHHGTSVYVQDVLGFGPSFVVMADHSLVPPVGRPDCGDGQIMPCDGPAPPSEEFFPLNVALDTANALLYEAFGEVCNPLDAMLFVGSTPTGAGRAQVPFGPGADGTYHVLIRADHDNGRAPTAGHVWTD